MLVNAFAWGDQDDADSIAAIHSFLDAGINWIDTAPVYGLGRSETRRRPRRRRTRLRRRPYVFAKGSLVWNDAVNITHSLKAGSLRQEVDDSLRRLGTDVIDL